MSTTNEKETFGQRLRRLMEAKGLNQSALAERSGIDRSHLNRMCNDKRRPKPDEVAWLASALGVAIDELLVDVDLPPEARRALDQGREAIERVLRAEAERDEAAAKADRLAVDLARERDEREHERVASEQRMHAAAAEHRQQLQGVISDAAAREGQQQVEIERLKALLGRVARQLQDVTKNRDFLRTQLAASQKQLADTRANKAAAQLFAGLAGAVIGRSID